MLIGFIIWSVVAVAFIVLGIVSRNAKEAVGFFSNVKAPEVSDVVNYNKAVSNIWFVFAILFEAIGVPILYMQQNSPLFLVIVLGAMFLSVGIMVAYMNVSIKYKK